jgi:hypothetical protein
MRLSPRTRWVKAAIRVPLLRSQILSAVDQFPGLLMGCDGMAVECQTQPPRSGPKGLLARQMMLHIPD